MQHKYEEVRGDCTHRKASTRVSIQTRSTARSQAGWLAHCMWVSTLFIVGVMPHPIACIGRPPCLPFLGTQSHTSAVVTAPTATPAPWATPHQMRHCMRYWDRFCPGQDDTAVYHSSHNGAIWGCDGKRAGAYAGCHTAALPVFYAGVSSHLAPELK
jgi:hypothetical protein